MKSDISMDEEREQGTAPESLHEDIRQQLSGEREDKLYELGAKGDRLIERLQSLEGKLDTIEAVKDDMRTEMEQLDHLERRNPDAAARSRGLLADEIRHNHIGQSRAKITDAITSAEAEDRDLEEAMAAVHADEDADGSSDYEAGGEADDEEAGDNEAEEEPGPVEDGYDDREEREHEGDRNSEGSPHHGGYDSPDASPDASTYSPDAPYDSGDGGGYDDDDDGGGYDDDYARGGYGDYDEQS